MSYIKRRHFLQFASSTLATLGLSQLDIMQQGDHYGKVLSQGTNRKLALLVGINQYSPSDGLPALAGCVNDVLLQKELLIHRFGFNKNDIVTLLDKQATRQNILTAFEQHLIKQAKPGDVVVFHFSGHGSQVQDPDRDAPDGLNSTLVPVDSPLPAEYPTSGGPVRDIMGHTLFLLMYALKTDKVTVVLDSCHSGGGKRGNFVVRSRDGGDKLLASKEEPEYQRQWLRKLELSSQEFIKKRRQTVAKGVVIASAKRDQYAVDVPFDGFHAGAFTYLLTQYLWQQPGDEPVSRAIVTVGRSTKDLARETGNLQDPEVEFNLSKGNSNVPIYFTRVQSLPAEAVVTQVTGDKVELWLGGLDPQSLEAFTKDSVFVVLDSKGGERGVVKLESRQGLIGKGTLQATARQGVTLQPGTLLQERIRSIPSNLTLKIGFDDSFDDSTAQQAIQALQSIQRIEPKPLGQQEVQYIFGRMTKTRYQQLQKKPASNIPQVSSFGLFLPSLDQIVPDSFGKAEETVTDAVKRLQPQIKSLLAARIFKQVLGNTNTSRINVTASMMLADSQQIVSKTFPIRSVQKVSASKQLSSIKPVNFSDSGVQKLTVGTQITFQIQNNESQSLYITILVIDATGEVSVIFPFNWSAPESAALVEPKQTKVIPQPDDGFKLTIGTPLGFSEALIIASTAPLRTCLKTLQEIARSQGLGNRRGPIPVPDEVLNVTNSLLDDLDAGTRSAINVEGIQLPSGVRGIDTKKLAAMAIAFEVVES